MKIEPSSTARFDVTVILLATLTALGPLAIDMYLPAFNAISASFDSPTSRVELSLTAFFLGLFIGQLLYGTAADRFGRKPPLYLGLVIFILASVALAFAPTIEAFIALRFLQAIGSCAGLVIARAMVRDMYTPRASAQVFSFLILVMGVAPILAPMMGAYITGWLNWQAIFLLMGAIAVVSLTLAHTRLPETRGPNPALRMRNSLPVYWSVLTDPAFIRYSLPGGVAQSGLFIYITGSPQLFIDHFGLAPTHYSWLFGANAIGIIGMSQLNAWLLRRRSSRKILNVSLPALGLVALALLAAGLTAAPFWLVVVPVFLYISTLGAVFPNAMAGALAKQSHRAGAASAMTGSLQFAIAGLVSAGVSSLGQWQTHAMPLMMAGSGLLALTLYRLMRPLDPPPARPPAGAET